MKLQILGTLLLAIPLLVWSCGGDTTDGSKEADPDTNTASAQLTGNVLNNCTEGSNTFAAISTIFQNNCVSCHGGDVPNAQAALDLSSSDTVILRGVLSEASQLEGKTSTEDLVDYIVSSNHPGSGSVSSESDLNNALATWFAAEADCLSDEVNSGSSGSSGSVGSGSE